MKITNAQLKQIVKEELNKVIKEMNRDKYYFDKKYERPENRDYEYGGGTGPGEFTSPIKGSQVDSILNDPNIPSVHKKKLVTLFQSGPEGRKQALELMDAMGYEGVEVYEELPPKGLSFRDTHDIEASQKQKLLAMSSSLQKAHEMYMLFLRANVDEVPDKFHYEDDELLKQFGDSYGKNYEQEIRQRIAKVKGRKAFNKVFSKRR